MRLFKFASAFCLIPMLASPFAEADAISTFDATGTFADGAALGGDLVIDTTTGSVVSADLTASAPDNLSNTNVFYVAYISGYGAFEIAVGGVNSTFPAFVLDLDATSLINYDGGVIYSTSDRSPDGITSDIDLTSAQQTFVSLTNGTLTAVSEPSSFALLMSAILGIGLVRRRRFRTVLNSPR